MPQRSQKICAVPGCPNKTLTRWCEVHTKKASIARPYDDRRGSSSQRGYDGPWRRLRLVALRRDNYLCLECLKTGRPTPAEEVHHIVGIDIAPELRLDLENLASVCGPCHKLLTAQEQGIFGRKAINKTFKH